MLQPVGGRKRSRIGVVPIPHMGVNLRDPLIEMGSGFASFDRNFVCENGKVSVREGYEQHATGVTGGVVRLMKYNDPVSPEIFATSSDSIFDVTSSGAVGAAAVSSLTNGQWDWINFTDLSGLKLVCANAADGVRTYDGSTWATSSITGATATDLYGLAAHQSRIWAIEFGTLSAWYMDNTFAASGAMTEFPIGALCAKGGQLVKIISVSRDGGGGLDDLLAFITSEGEILLYSGITPGGGGDMVKVGTYEVGRPVGGTLCATKVGGSIWVVTEDGPVDLNDVIAGRGTNANEPLTRVSPDFVNAARGYAAQSGWQVLSWPSRGWTMCNLPQGSGATPIQHVYSHRSGTWSRFTELAATYWMESENTLYFGTAAGVVNRGFAGQRLDGNSSIQAEIVWAPSRLGTPAIKAFQHGRLHFRGPLTAQLFAETLPDYASFTPLITNVVEGELPVWDVAEWGDPWGAVVLDRVTTFGAEGMGVACTIRVVVYSGGVDLELLSAEVAYSVGSTI